MCGFRIKYRESNGCVGVADGASTARYRTRFGILVESDQSELCVRARTHHPGARVKKEVSRERKLPAFSLSIGELEALWSHLIRELFDDPGDIRARIQIWLPSEQLEFANLEELKQYPHLPSRVTNFDIWLSQTERRIAIGPRWRSGFRARVSATAETEAWCAGAIETVFSFVQSYKLWYSWFLSTRVSWVLNLMAIAPTLALMSTGGRLERVHPFLAERPLLSLLVGLEPFMPFFSYGMTTSACCRPQSFASLKAKVLFESTP